MSIQVSKEIKIALLGIISILLFVFGFNFLKGSGVFSSTKLISAEYDNVQGITPSSFVQLQGYNIGTVTRVSLSKEHPGKILVEMNINKKIPIPIDSKAEIVSLDLLGTKAVSIKRGISTQLIEKNGTLTGSIELGTIDGPGASVTPVVNQVQTTLLSLDTTIKSINNILDPTSQQQIKNSLGSLNSTMNDFKAFSHELNGQSAKISSLITNLNSFSSNLDKNNQTITKVLNNAEVTTNNLSKINFDETVSELKKTLDDLQITLQKVNSGSGSLGLLMNDDKLYKNLKNTLSTANNLLYDINAHPSRYINIRVFGKNQQKDYTPQAAPNSID